MIYNKRQCYCGETYLTITERKECYKCQSIKEYYKTKEKETQKKITQY